ncbi:MAG: type II secretion system F family protein [Bacillota bacterium]|nr:type II secretion system F family protein [Bacillota bacterium]
MRQAEVWAWCRQVEVAARAGLPAGPVLERLPGKMAGRLRKRLGQGHTLAEALRACGVSSPWEAARLEQAVRAGRGAVMLGEMAEEGLGRATRTGEQRAGLVYPLLVVGLGGAAATLVGLFLLPALLPPLQLVGVLTGLPLATRLLLWAAPRWQAGLGVAALAAACMTLSVAGKLGPVGDRAALALPGMGRVLMWRERARLLDSLSRLSRAGGLTRETVGCLAAGCGNGYLRRRLERAARDVRAGAPALEAIARSGGLPPALAAQLAGAEAAGEAATVCHDLAAYCRSRERQLERLALSLLEPVLTLLAASVVALVALAVVQPLYLALAHLP